MQSLVSSLDSVFAQVVAIAAALGAAGWILRVIYRGCRSLVRWMKKAARNLDATNDLVQAQLTTNGGGSLLDKVNTSHATVAVLTEQVAGLTSQVQAVVAIAQQNAESQERIEEQVAAIDTRLESGEKRFKKLDRMTQALEVVAKANHPEDYVDGPEIED